MIPIQIRKFPVVDRWCVHSYYTMCPYAPDDSGRILIAGADLDRGVGEVLILSSDGKVLDRFGEHPLQGSFYHTGWWQSWSPCGRYVYYQAGSMQQPRIARRDLESGTDKYVEGDMEGAPPHGEPVLAGLLGMLYAAGYGDLKYKPEEAPVPFQARDRHGIFEYRFDPPSTRLSLSVGEILRNSTDYESLIRHDQELKSRLGAGDGLTLMAFCVRWSMDGSRLVFFFGNHEVDKSRQEPKIKYMITANRNMTELHTAMDFNYGKRGVHWSWQPDNEYLIGYAGHPDDPSSRCLAEVKYDGTGYRMLSEHASGGHPTVSPTNPNLIVTDENTPDGGAVVFISKRTGEELARVSLPKFIGSQEPPGRNPQRVCHHPVFNQTGDKVLCNSLPGRYSTLVEIEVPNELLDLDSRR